MKITGTYTVVAFIVTVKLLWKKVNVHVGKPVISQYSIPTMSCSTPNTPPFVSIGGMANEISLGRRVEVTTSVCKETVDAKYGDAEVTEERDDMTATFCPADRR